MIKVNVTRITRARIVHSPFTALEMASLAETVTTSVIARIKRAENLDNQPSKPLKPSPPGKRGYIERKQKAGVPPYRNWIGPVGWPMNRIKTLRAMKVLRANENVAVIGFIDDMVKMIVRINQRIEKMFGLAQTDKIVLLDTAKEIYRLAYKDKVEISK